MPLEVLLVRDGTRLAAADTLSAEAIAGIAHRETVTASIRRPRNPKHHRKFFALIKVVMESQNYFATDEDLIDELKMATGLYTTKKRLDGSEYNVVKSISWASMDQNRFEQWYARAVEIILTKVIPHTKREDLEERVHEILGEPTHRDLANGK